MPAPEIIPEVGEIVIEVFGAGHRVLEFLQVGKATDGVELAPLPESYGRQERVSASVEGQVGEDREEFRVPKIVEPAADHTRFQGHGRFVDVQETAAEDAALGFGAVGWESLVIR